MLFQCEQEIKKMDIVSLSKGGVLGVEDGMDRVGKKEQNEG